jgi:putative ABC transport system permease protein
MRRFFGWSQKYLTAIRVGWFLAVRNIKHSSKWTTGLITFIMILTFLNLVVVSGLLSGLIAGSFKQFKESYSGDVIITSAPQQNYIKDSQALVGFLENHPEVKAIAPRYGVSGQVLGTLNDLPNKGERANQIGIRITGIDFEKEEIVTGFSQFLKYGEMLDSHEEGYALIGANMIKKYSTFADANIPGLDLLNDVDVGTRVRVTLTSAGTVVKKDFIIKGIVKSKVDEISTRLFIPAAELRRMLPSNREQYQEIAVLVEDPSYAPILVAQVKDFLSDPVAARVQTSLEAIPSFLRDIETTFRVLGNALSSIALVVASITIFIVIFVNAVTKRKSIGIMKGIGIPPNVIVFSYIFQAIVYAVIGSIFGLALTFGFLKPYFDANPIDFPFSDGILVATLSGSLIRVAILFVVTLIAGYIPAKLIVRKNTLDSILGR